MLNSTTSFSKHESAQVHVLEMLTLFWLFFMSAMFILRIDVPDPTSVASDATLETAGDDALRLVVGTPAEESSNHTSHVAELLAFGKHDEACNEILSVLGPTVDGRCWLAKNSASSSTFGDGSSPLGKVITTHRMMQVDFDVWTLSLDVWHRGGGS